MITITNVEAKELLAYTNNFRDWLRENLLKRLNNSLSGLTPSLPYALFEDAGKIVEALNKHVVMDPVWNEKTGAERSVDIDDRYRPLLIRIVLHNRKAIAHSLEITRVTAIHPETHSELDERLAIVEKYTRMDWFSLQSASRIPSLAEYINAQELDLYIRGDQLQLQPRIYDEKFHLLMSPALFIPDMNYFLRLGELKGLEVCVGYIDIDNFKSYNSELGGESVVDRIFLPFFMRFLASHFFHHGYVYRYGGDEYVVVLPFISNALAKRYFIELRHGLATLQIEGVKKAITISTGLFHTSCASQYIPREMEERANKAKTFAKQNGKDGIYEYNDLDKTRQQYVKVE